MTNVVELAYTLFEQQNQTDLIDLYKSMYNQSPDLEDYETIVVKDISYFLDDEYNILFSESSIIINNIEYSLSSSTLSNQLIKNLVYLIEIFYDRI